MCDYLIVEVKAAIRSHCGNYQLNAGPYKVCWTDGPRFTICGLPKVIFFTSDVKVFDWDTSSEAKANLMKKYHNKGAAMQNKTEINMPPMTNGGTIEKLGDAMLATYNAATPKLTGTKLVEMTTNDYTTCEVQYQDGGKLYTYKVSKSFELEPGDKAVVKVPSGELKVVSVMGVHDTPQLQAGINYKWVVDVVCSSEYEARIDLEKQLDEEIEVARKKAAEQAVLKKLMAHSEDGSILRQLLEKHLR